MLTLEPHFALTVAISPSVSKVNVVVAIPLAVGLYTVVKLVEASKYPVSVKKITITPLSTGVPSFSVTTAVMFEVPPSEINNHQHK